MTDIKQEFLGEVLKLSSDDAYELPEEISFG
jgi:hypothetical protein